ncbi:MAG: histidine kinase [Steroidobacteraceae bacterium]
MQRLVNVPIEGSPRHQPHAGRTAWLMTWLARRAVAPRLSRVRAWSTVALVVLLLGVVDYVTGSFMSMLVFYVAPVALAVVWLGMPAATFTAVACVIVWWTANAATDAPQTQHPIVWWNTLVILSVFLIVAATLRGLVLLTRRLEERVHDRTRALEEEIAVRKRLERRLIDVTLRERNAISHELHDGLCQHLTATGFAAKLLHDRLAARGEPDCAEKAQSVVHLLEKAVAQTRSIAQRHLLPMIDPQRLVGALESLAANTMQESGITCHFRLDGDPRMPDQTAASHLFCIAQEAVRNAVRHSHAQCIDISLAGGPAITLVVADDGDGINPARRSSAGLGLQIMLHRAALLGGDLGVTSAPGAGTCITCRVAILSGGPP